MRLKNIQLWKIDNYNLNLYNIFKWYLNLKKLYLVFFSMYSLNKYRIIYIYYYKFKTFKKKRARSIFKRRDNAIRVLFTRHKLTKYKRKFLILAKYSFFKPKGTKNFIFKNFITNKKKHKILLGYPNKILLTINFRNLLLIPGVRFKKTKSNTSVIFFRKKLFKKILHKNLKKKLLDQKVSLFELKKKLLSKYKKKVVFLKRNRLKFYKWKKHKKFNQIKNNMYLYEILKKIKLKKQKRSNYELWKTIRLKQNRLLRNVIRKFSYKFYKIRSYYIKKNSRNKLRNRIFFPQLKRSRFSFKFSKRLIYFIKKYSRYSRKLRKYTKFKKANLNHHFKTNSIILANKKIQNYYNKLINTYVRNYPKYKIWKLKKFFFRREIEYVDLYDSIQRIRKKLKRKSIKTIAKNLRLGQQVFFSHAVPDYSSHKYNSYKNYKSLLPKKKLKYRSKKSKLKRVKRKYLKKYFKKKLRNRRLTIKKKIILKHRKYSKFKTPYIFFINKKRKKLLNSKKLLKYKLSFFKYYFSKYITNSFIVFRNIKKINSNVKRLFKKYHNFFWFLSRFTFFNDLVYSVLLSKLFVVSDMLGYMIAKLFITPRNHWYMMSNIKNLWTFLNFNVTLKLNIKGKWFGRPRAKEKLLFVGDVKRQTSSIYLDYYYHPITTIYGVFSIKIWLNKQWQ